MRNLSQKSVKQVLCIRDENDSNGNANTAVARVVCPCHEVLLHGEWLT
jgi:hypothetical protein